MLLPPFNALHTLISIACHLLGRQIKSQAVAFETEGGFTERLYARERKPEKKSIRGIRP